MKWQDCFYIITPPPTPETSFNKIYFYPGPPEKPVITGFPRHTVREGDILSLECRSQVFNGEC